MPINPPSGSNLSRTASVTWHSTDQSVDSVGRNYGGQIMIDTSSKTLQRKVLKPCKYVLLP